MADQAVMRAVVCKRFGLPDAPGVLELKEIPKPLPNKAELLIRVRATSVNDYDWSMVRGQPLIYRLLFGFFKPKHPVPGMELSGTVEAVGEDVDLFEVGDEVYGDISAFGFGSFAGYLCVNQQAVVSKPADISFEEAAALPHASMLAYQALVESGGLQSGQKILINGAGGGVGTLAFQIAKQYQAEVSGVDSGEKLTMMKALGFDHVIDYRKEDFCKGQTQYDLIIDAKTTRGPFAYAAVLKRGGKYVTVGGRVLPLLQCLLLSPLVKRLRGCSIRILALKPNKDLDYIMQLYREERLKPVIDGPYAMSKTPWAIRYFGEGKHSGKVVIKVD